MSNCPNWTTYPEPGADTKWLLMVYMAATAPNLQQPLGLDLRELNDSLRAFGDQGKYVDVVVQIDTPTSVSKVFKLQNSDMPKLLAVHNTVVDNTLECFVRNASKKYANEAKYQRALVVWGHAAGIGRGFEPTRFFGTEVPSLLPSLVPFPGPGSSVAQAGAVWAQLRKLKDAERPHLVGFDACYMASAEVTSQIYDYGYMLAPQAGIALEGWHYDLLLDNIVANPGVKARLLGLQVVRQVGLSPSSPDGLTLVHLARRSELEDALRILAATLYDSYFNEYRESQARRWIQNAFHDAAWAHVRQFLDLGDLARTLATTIPSRSIREAARQLLAVVSKRGNDALIVDQFSVLDVPLSGLSIYSPWPRATPRLTQRGARNVQVDRREYCRLELAKRTRHDTEKYVSHPDDADFDTKPLADALGVVDCVCGAKDGCDGHKDYCKGWVDFMYDPQAMQDAERRWVRQEARDRVGELEARVHHAGRIDDPKPAGRIDDPKPAGRIDDPKPAGRGDDPRSPRADDPWAF